MKKHLKLPLLAAAALLILAACRVVLVPEYNQNIEQQIISAEKLNDKFYLTLLQKPAAGRAYDSCKTKYVEIEAEINSLLYQNMARPKNTDMLAILNTLKKKFTEYRDYHKKNGTLAEGEIILYEADIMALWQPLLVAEHALKNQK